MIFNAEKALREYGDKIPEATKSEVEKKIEATRKALEGNDSSAIKRAAEELGLAFQQIGASMYGQQTNGSGDMPGGDGYGEPSDEDVIEGDFTER